MNKKFLLVIGMFMMPCAIVDAQNEGGEIPFWHPTLPHATQKSKGLCNTRVITSYNASSTALSVKFPSNGPGGKVEIYRNGARVVSANAAAGATLSYTLRCYGRGEYMVVVSQGDTVVCNRCLSVK